MGPEVESPSGSLSLILGRSLLDAINQRSEIQNPPGPRERVEY